MNLLSLQILPQELASKLALEAKQFVQTEQELSSYQWRIGAAISVLEKEFPHKELFWHDVINVLNASSAGWMTFSKRNVYRWMVTVRRWGNNPDAEKYRTQFPFEYFAISAELVGREICETVNEPMEWAKTNYPVSVDDIKDHFHKETEIAPVWEMAVKQNVRTFELWRELTIWNKLSPLVKKINEIFLEGEE